MNNSVIAVRKDDGSDDRIDIFSNTNLFKPEKSSHARKVKRLKQNLTGWCFSLWPLYTYALFALVPFALSVYLSLTELNEWRITQARFIGFDNYVWLLTSANSNFFWSLFRTLYYSLSLPITIFLGLFSSILLTSRVKAKKLWRSILYIPNVCSSVGVTMMWKLIFDQNVGIINEMIVAMGGERVNFFNNFYLFMPLVIFTTTWGAGSGSILFQAALEQINGSLVEAAKVDGASSAQVLFNITLPAISPT
ncbi:MAG: carbohydrate ABC transporter permease, partial [Candidatus Neoclostridium sp.]